MIKLGIIGLNEGNGHPFSYAAIFNGYNEDALQKLCPYELIREYLPKEHGNKNGLENAKVTHIWTQDKKLSEDVAKVSLIENIVDDYKDLIGKVDAVILARDDVENHLQMMRPFLEKKVPLFVDKQLVATASELDEFMKLCGLDYPLMAGSSARYTRDVAKARQEIDIGSVRTIHGVSRESWMRYGHHLLEGIVEIFGLDIESVQPLAGKKDHDIVQIKYKSGIDVILECIEDVHLPIQFTVFSSDSEPRMVPFTDYFYSFKEMLNYFVKMVETGEKRISYEEIIIIVKIILQGKYAY